MKVNYTLKRIVSEKEIERLTELADEIWHESFTEILSMEQIDYMVEKFQSYSALKAAIETGGYEYFFLKKGESAIGYTGIKEENELLFLSKIYLKKEYRGKGLGHDMLASVIETAVERGKNAVYLTVNRNNNAAIRIYTKMGFLIENEQVTDIENGFIMDDYVMVYRFIKN